MEGIGFRDRIHEFTALGVKILGISVDTPEANAAFAQRYGFPFPLLSDPAREICQAYHSCAGAEAPVSERHTYVIGPRGQVLYVVHDRNAKEHPVAVLDFLYGTRTPADHTPNSLVYALGQIGYDFGSGRFREFVASDSGRGAHNRDTLLRHLDDNPYLMGDIIWTLNQDGTPIYALRLAGAFAGEEEHREYLFEFLVEQLFEEIERISVPGVIRGQVRLSSGQLVPVIEPAVQGMYSWTTAALLDLLHEEDPAGAASVTKNFLDRVYYQLRNLGRTSQERAMNYLATNAYQISQIARAAVSENLVLHQIDAEPSVICRPDSDCWDIKLALLEPGRRYERARKVYRATVDVSDVLPVPVGDIRSWYVI